MIVITNKKVTKKIEFNLKIFYKMCNCCKKNKKNNNQNGEDEGRFIRLHQTLNEKKKPIFITNRIKTTKYTIFTFLPKNLFEQFSRIANFYFLIIVGLLYVPGVPIDAGVAIVPLIIVVGISAIREAVEDFLRYKSDQKVNATIGHKLSDGRFSDIKWQDILVGDFILVRKDEQVPADIVLFSTDTPEGVAYVDTCNLDGETNLKVRQALPLTASLQTAADVANFNGNIRCDDCNNMLYTFHGCLETNGQQYPLENKQVLLRGCVLRNTQFAIGAVVYTGLETKLMMNSSAARSKRSNLERSLNIKLISVFVFIIVWAIIAAACGFSFQQRNFEDKAWYFYQDNLSTGAKVGHFFILLVSNIVIINAMIPISLYVTLEIVRVFQSLFVSWDATMYDVETETSAQARTSNISDDLGQIEYVFSDKTGTLTCNVMEFMKCSIAGQMYGTGTTEVAYAAAKRRGMQIEPPSRSGKAFRDARFQGLLSSGNPPEEVRNFLWLLSICHSVIPEEDSTQPFGIAFQASSPDEAALVKAAADFGYIFTKRTPNSVTLTVNGREVVVPVLAVLEFSSERKRSSVIIRHPENNKIVLFCKGADDLIYQRLQKDSPNQFQTKEHLKQFAADGLRTLCLAYRYIDEQFYKEWNERFNEASCAIQNREDRVNEVCNEIESDLLLLGATAIEDKLQLDVPDTIEALLSAHINVWVITGDKRETAINIGFACSLLSSDMRLITLDSSDPNVLLNQMNTALSDNENKLALVASGSALYFLLQDDQIDSFFLLAKKCQSVVCCRVSPLQKASIVRMMRKKTKKLTLAIGDGANDVGMILQADVGVGISGKEGRQAVLSSDYSIAQFRYLKRLLMVHGRLNFYRNVDLVNYSFYKNMCFSFCQILFQFFSSFSGNTVYDSFLYTIFNVIFTSIPPVIYAAAERDVGLDSMMHIPELYYFDGQRPWMMSVGRFLINLLVAICHSLIVFFVTYLGTAPLQKSDGKMLGLTQFGITLYGCVVLIVNIRIASMCHYWTWMHHVFIWGSILIFPLAVLVVNYIPLSMEVYQQGLEVFKQASFYASVVGTAIFAILPVITIDAIHNSLNIVTNHVLLHEKTKKHVSLRMTVEKFYPQPPPSTEVVVYPDNTNETGYNFDEPVPLSTSHRYKSVLNMPFIEPEPNGPHINEYDFRTSPIMRQKHISTFGLDQL